MSHRLVQGVVQGASYKLQSGCWLIHQALLGQTSVVHHLPGGRGTGRKLLQSGRWLIRQALLGLIFVLHRLVRDV